MSNSLIRATLAAVLLLCARPGTAQPAGVVGRWEGALDVGGATLPLVMRVEEAGADLRALLDSPSQGAFGLPGEISFDGDSLTLVVPSVGGTYRAGVRDAGLHGTWRQGGAAFPLVLRRTADAPPVESEPDPAGYAGDWGGRLELGVIEVALVLHLTFDGTGYAALLDSPDQAAFGIPAEALVRGDSLFVTVPAAGATIRGRLQDGAIVGTFSQGGADHPLRLTPEGALVRRNRPQEPRPPFPYAIENVTFASAPGVTLAGTLTRPQGEGPFPAAVLVTGSGPQDRDEALMGHRPFAVLSDHLTRRGVLVLRYDDRGFGASTGNFGSATTRDFAEDAAAAVRFLEDRADVRTIGVVGHSEGGLVAPLIDADVDFIVMLAGTAVPGFQVIAHQGVQMARAEGLSAEAAALEERVVTAALQRVAALPLHEPIPATLRDSILTEFRAAYSARSPEDRAATASTDSTAADAELLAGMERLDSPWTRFFLAYDPAPAVRALAIPVLALFGELDLQVTPEQNEGPMRAALEESASPDWTVEVVPRANHLFQSAQTGSPREYAVIEETMSPAVLERIAGWILAREH